MTETEAPDRALAEGLSRTSPAVTMATRNLKAYSAIVESFARVVDRLPDDARLNRFSFVMGASNALEAYSASVDGVAAGEPLDGHSEAMASAVQAFEALAFELAELCHRFPHLIRPGERAVHESLAARVVALASRHARALAPIPTAEEAARAAHTERQRRYRVRKRGRVAKRVRVNVHDGDLALLRQLGFLTADQKDDDAAIADALEAFLLNCFLGTPAAASGASWRERVAAQRTRLALLKGGKG